MGPSDIPVAKVLETPKPIIQYVDRIVEIPVDKIVTKEVVRHIEIPVEKIVTKEVAVEVIKEVEKIVEVPVEVVRERTIFIDKPYEVVREVKILDIERLMAAQNEIRNLNKRISILRLMLIGSIIVAIILGVR